MLWTKRKEGPRKDSKICPSTETGKLQTVQPRQLMAFFHSVPSCSFHSCRFEINYPYIYEAGYYEDKKVVTPS